MTSLENMRIFMRSVELGSFSAAGRALRLSGAVVSYRIQSLEAELGCRLLVRTTRRMSLTEQGRVFYERCLEVIEAVQRAEASVAAISGGLRGPLRVTGPVTLGRRLLGPLAGSFLARHPEVDLRLRLSDHLLDLVGEQIDVALRMARFDDSSFTIRKIADLERVLCAAPAYLDRHGRPERPADLAAHRCLLLRYPGAQQFRWTLRVEGEPLTCPVAGPLDADDGEVLTGWALAGEGIVLKPRVEVAHALGDGRLVVVLPACPPLPVTLAALTPTRRASALSRSFVDALVDHVRAALRASDAGGRIREAGASGMPDA